MCHLFVEGKMGIHYPAGGGGDTSTFLPQMPVQQAAVQAESRSSQTFTLILKVAVGMPACLHPVVSGFLSSCGVIFRSAHAESSLLKTAAAFIIANAY